MKITANTKMYSKHLTSVNVIDMFTKTIHNNQTGRSYPVTKKTRLNIEGQTISNDRKRT